MRNSEHGNGRAGFLITLTLFVAGTFLAVKVVPVRIDGYKFRELMREEARNAAVHRNDSVIVQRLLDEAKSMEIPLQAADLTISRSTVAVTISAKYKRPIDLRVGTYVYKFNASEKAPLF